MEQPPSVVVGVVGVPLHSMIWSARGGVIGGVVSVPVTVTFVNLILSQHPTPLVALLFPVIIIKTETESVTPGFTRVAVNV